MLIRGSVLGQEVRRANPMFERAKRVLHGLAAPAHHFRLTIQPQLHGLQYRLKRWRHEAVLEAMQLLRIGQLGQAELQ